MDRSMTSISPWKEGIMLSMNFMNPEFTVLHLATESMKRLVHALPVAETQML
jgi:hypothetical protein